MQKIKPEVSKKREYWISKNRYYELKFFCLQYKDWEDDLRFLKTLESRSIVNTVRMKDGRQYSKTEAIALLRLGSKRNIEIVKEAVKKTTEESKILSEWLMRGVTEGISYDLIRAQNNGIAPCNEKEYYKIYRRFFYELHLLKIHEGDDFS